MIAIDLRYFNAANPKDLCTIMADMGNVVPRPGQIRAWEYDVRHTTAREH